MVQSTANGLLRLIETHGGNLFIALLVSFITTAFIISWHFHGVVTTHGTTLDYTRTAVFELQEKVNNNNDNERLAILETRYLNIEAQLARILNTLDDMTENSLRSRP